MKSLIVDEAGKRTSGKQNGGSQACAHNSVQHRRSKRFHFYPSK